MGRSLQGRRPFGAAVLAAVVAVACGEQLVTPQPGRPIVVLVLNRTTAVDGDTVQPAFVLRRTGGLQPAYATADAFDLRRAGDGARFGWRSVARTGVVDFERGTSLPLSRANYLLDGEPAAPGLLGLQGIRPGGRYRLRVELQGTVIRGTARVPGRFSLRLRRRDDGVAVTWPQVRGAGGYEVTTDPLLLTLRPRTEPFTRDTSFFVPDSVVRFSRPEDGKLDVLVTALDPNLAAYARNPDLERAGMDAGLGVFGAVSSARATIELPPEGGR